MNTRTRWITASLAAVTVLSFASSAFADHRRFKGVPVERVVIREHSSSAGPALAGLIGGFLIGTAVASNVHPVVVHTHYYHHTPVAVYRYYDPYGGYWYDSLDQCAGMRHHPRYIQVIDIRNGRQVRALAFNEGEWRRVSGDYDERDFDGDDD